MREPLWPYIAAVLAEVAAESLVTQDELEQRSGINQGTISQLLRGRRKLSIEHADALSEALGIPFAAVIADAVEARAKHSPL
ncbi:helix-turn-helix domain-containing protein [Agromyces aureus]|uniref:HTH cro/C1-type domain-containing protein n=1 Tax=Agromyces aureus TaxID=453304 RepID=A0A191WF12_9MICO|nr:helix-turn-helix transcriptional regulator [Agromyces aureus]ANJ26778.1 hypothetical protein ATC03_08695 [Agromyces aureus]